RRPEEFSSASNMIRRRRLISVILIKHRLSSQSCYPLATTSSGQCTVLASSKPSRFDGNVRFTPKSGHSSHRFESSQISAIQSETDRTVSWSYLARRHTSG